MLLPGIWYPEQQPQHLFLERRMFLFPPPSPAFTTPLLFFLLSRNPLLSQLPCFLSYDGIKPEAGMKGGGWDVQLRGAEESRAAPAWGWDWQLHFALWTWSCASSWRKSPGNFSQLPESCPFFLLGHVDDERHEQRGRGAANPREGGSAAVR